MRYLPCLSDHISFVVLAPYIGPKVAIDTIEQARLGAGKRRSLVAAAQLAAPPIAQPQDDTATAADGADIEQRHEARHQSPPRPRPRPPNRRETAAKRASKATAKAAKPAKAVKPRAKTAAKARPSRPRANRTGERENERQTRVQEARRSTQAAAAPAQTTSNAIDAEPGRNQPHAPAPAEVDQAKLREWCSSPRCNPAGRLSRRSDVPRSSFASSDARPCAARRHWNVTRPRIVYPGWPFVALS